MSWEAEGDSLFETPGRSWKAEHTVCCWGGEKAPTATTSLIQGKTLLPAALAATSKQKSQVLQWSVAGG